MRKAPAISGATVEKAGMNVATIIGQILTRKFKGSENPVTTHFITGLVGVAVTSLAWQSGATMPTAADAFFMICLGLSTGVGHTC